MVAGKHQEEDRNGFEEKKCKNLAKGREKS